MISLVMEMNVSEKFGDFVTICEKLIEGVNFE